MTLCTMVLGAQEVAITECRSFRRSARGNQFVEFPQVGEIHEPGVRVKSFQGRVLVIRVNGDMGHLLVFEVLNEIRGKEAFSNSTLAVENEIDLFLHG